MRARLGQWKTALFFTALWLPGTVWAAPPALGSEVADPLLDDRSQTRAVLQIESEDGICLWSISGDDELIRLPLKSDRFGSVLVSARFDGDQLSVSLAGEKEPLSTVPFGTYSLSLNGPPIAVEDLKSRTAEGWKLRVLPPGTKGTITGCCSCSLLKINCCPNPGKCLGCSTCGQCCG